MKLQVGGKPSTHDTNEMMCVWGGEGGAGIVMLIMTSDSNRPPRGFNMTALDWMHSDTNLAWLKSTMGFSVFNSNMIWYDMFNIQKKNSPFSKMVYSAS